jgi:hypothetical protein
VARVEAHLAALPRHDNDGRLSAPEQVAAPLIARMRTTDATTIDEGVLLEVEGSLLKLSDLVTTNYFTTRARSDAPWDSLG